MNTFLSVSPQSFNNWMFISWFAFFSSQSFPLYHFSYISKDDTQPKCNCTHGYNDRVDCLPCRWKTLWHPWHFCMWDQWVCLPIKLVPCVLGAQKFLVFQESPTHSSWKMITLKAWCNCNFFVIVHVYSVSAISPHPQEAPPPPPWGEDGTYCLCMRTTFRYTCILHTLSWVGALSQDYSM